MAARRWWQPANPLLVVATDDPLGAQWCGGRSAETTLAPARQPGTGALRTRTYVRRPEATHVPVLPQNHKRPHKPHICSLHHTSRSATLMPTDTGSASRPRLSCSLVRCGQPRRPRASRHCQDHLMALNTMRPPVDYVARQLQIQSKSNIDACRAAASSSVLSKQKAARLSSGREGGAERVFLS